MPYANLHMHSTYSDAALTPEQKRAQYDRDNERRRAKRAAETPEEKEERRARYAGYARARAERRKAQEAG